MLARNVVIAMPHMTNERTHFQIVLGSRSPRRLELLRLLVPSANIVVHPPADAHEPGFDDCRDWEAIESRLIDVARLKCRDVLRHIGRVARRRTRETTKIIAVIAADTVIVVDDDVIGNEDNLRDGNGIENGAGKVVLGKPPLDDSGTEVVRRWFRRCYAGRTHTAATGLCIALPEGMQRACITRTEVTFRADVDRWLEWYLSTGEPAGKAGGYALQGAGGIFITGVRGSLSNVVGLPLETVMNLCEDLGIDLASFSHDG